MDRLTRTVREQVALGRLLALGGQGDAAWITERAAAAVLRAAAAEVAGVRLGAVSFALDGPGGAPDSVPDLPAAAPVGALPYLPVRVAAAFEAAAGEPLPPAAGRLRSVLLAAAEEALGMTVAAVDLTVTGLLEEAAAAATVTGAVPDVPGPDGWDGPAGPDGPDAAVEDGTAGRVAEAVRAVPGVVRLTRRLPGLGTGVQVEETGPDAAGSPRERRVRVQIAVGRDRSPLGVAREVAAAVRGAATPGPVAVVVVVTDAAV